MEKSNFCNRIEKRIRKDIRINKIFTKGDKIYVKDKLSKYLIEKILGTMPKTFVNSPKKANKVIIKYTLDDECNDFLENFMFGTKKKIVKGIKLLKTITDKDALLFARYNDIDFKVNKKDQKIKEILDELEKSYPQTRFSLLKSIESLK
jgi:hypothetical protein